MHCHSKLVALFILFSASLAGAQDRWYMHSLRPYWGHVDNAGRIDGRDTYNDLDLGSEAEMGLGFTMALTDDFDLEFVLAQVSGSGIQENIAGAGNDNNYLAVDLELTRLLITAKWRHIDPHMPFVTWWYGGGVHSGLIETDEQQFVQVSGGRARQPVVERVSTILGIHGSAGLDLYPMKSSALALSLETRLAISMTSGPFEGDVNSFAFLLGIRWDFWPRTL